MFIAPVQGNPFQRCTRTVRNFLIPLEKPSGRQTSGTLPPEFAMIDPKNFEQIFDSLRRSVPGGLAQDVEKNLRAALNAALTRLDLVTREELDVQMQVLARTRERLEALEKQVTELERRLAGK